MDKIKIVLEFPKEGKVNMCLSNLIVSLKRMDIDYNLDSNNESINSKFKHKGIEE